MNCQKRFSLPAILILTAAFISLLWNAGTTEASEYPKFDGKSPEISGDYYVIDELHLRLMGETTSKISLLVNNPDSFSDLVALDVLHSDGEEYFMPVEGAAGYNVRIKPARFLSDYRSEVFLTAEDGGSGGRGSSFVVSIAGQLCKIIFDSNRFAQFEMKGEFLDGYRAAVEIPDLGKTITVDLATRKDYYDSTGVYDKNTGKPGKVQFFGGAGFADTSGLGEPTADGLSTIEARIVCKGANNADTLFTLKAQIEYVDGDWKITKTTFDPASGIKIE